MLYEGFERVRITDMRGVDLSRWRFDWDLTFTAMVAHSDGTVLHRYGGRDVRGADRWLSTDSLVRFLEAGLVSHREHKAVEGSQDDRRGRPIFLEEVPDFMKRDRGECIHCHSVRPSLRRELMKAELWREELAWVHPPPSQVGLDLDPDDQQLITSVVAGSPSDRAGLKVADRITRAGEVPVATATDLMHALDLMPAAGGDLSLELQRGGVTMRLDPGWKRADPRDFAWRSSKFGLFPAPGFGGPQLLPGEVARAGLAEGTFAFRVDYLVDWGEDQRLGRAAARYGLRKGQVVLGTSVERRFDSVSHFHAWWRLTREVGEELEVVLWEDGVERRLPWKVIE